MLTVKRLSRRALLAGAASLWPSAVLAKFFQFSAAPTPPTPAMRAFDFYSKFGVNGQLDSGGTVSQQLSDMTYLGIKNIRSVAYGSTTSEANSWMSSNAQMTAAGVRQQIFLQSATGGASFNLISDWIGALKTYIVTPYGANMLVGVCGPNEVNIQQFEYNRTSVFTLNPYFISPLVTLSNGNLTVTHTGATGSSTTASFAYHGTGNYYFSVTYSTVNNSTNVGLGFITATASFSFSPGNDTNGVGIFANAGGEVQFNGSSVATTGVTPWPSGSVIDVAITINAGSSVVLWTRLRGGLWNNSATATPGGTGGITVTGLNSYSLAPAVFLASLGDVATIDLTTNLSITGFSPWNSANSDVMIGVPAANTAQADLYAAMKADPALSGISVDQWPIALLWSASGIGNLTSICDRANIHDYYSADNVNQFSGYIGTIPPTLQQYLAFNQPFCNQPHFITSETGWTTPPTGPGDGKQCNEYTQARLLLNDLFDHAMLSYCDAVYIFTLRWGTVDLTDPGYGVIHDDGTPKIAGTAIHNLMQILTDSGSGAATFVPTPFSYSLAGMPAASGNFVIAKSNGAFDILLWNETQIWNVNTAAQISIPTSTVTVSLPAGSTGSVYDPVNSGTTAIATFSTVNQVVVGLNDAPLIIEVTSHF